MAGTKAGAVKARNTKALGGGLKLRDAKKRKGVKKRKTAVAAFGKFKAIKNKKGKKRKAKRSDQQQRQAVLDTIGFGGKAEPRPGAKPDPMLFEVNDEATRKIEGLAHQYKAAVRAYTKAGDDVKHLKPKLIDAVKGSDAKPSPKDGAYKIRAGDSVVSVTPSDEKVKVVLDEDETDE